MHASLHKVALALIRRDDIHPRWPRPVAGLLLLGLAIGPTVATGQFASAERGARLLQERRCTLCHTVTGRGGGRAPDLARRSKQPFTPATLTAMMWNHGPSMWSQMAARGVEVPRLSQNEIEDLFTYFYSLRYFDPPGDAGHGKRVFVQKRCDRCHSGAAREAPQRGPPVVEWPMIEDPVRWSELMWNHASGMIDAMDEAGLRWPELTVQNMVDLLVYLENLPNRSRRTPTLTLSDPDAGRRLFQERGCLECHTVGTKQSGKRDLLAATRQLRTLTEFAVAMWNHAPRMRRATQRSGAAFPRFQENEMSQLLSFLFVQRYFEAEGNAGRGETVFSAKGCASCHGDPNSGAPELRDGERRFSASRLAAALWQHGPDMLAAMRERSMAWPAFSEAEMLNLIAYLNGREP